MDDLNEMARRHSAGATVRHVSPFDNLPSHKNEESLSAVFIRKWAAPYYMEIASYHNLKWIDIIKDIAPEITPQICLSLLGDFNWRTRLVGSYFAALKNDRSFVDIIGTHLLKSEVCCVAHVYALTLAFFNDEKGIEYLKKYLEYYLTQPHLYFDQKYVMEAILYLDKKNNSNLFERHIDSWQKLIQERQKIEQERARKLSEIYPELELENDAQNELHSDDFSTLFFEQQIAILNGLIYS